MKPFLNEAECQTLARIVSQWRLSMEPNAQPGGGPFAMLGRGDRGQLRRCATSEDVWLLSAFHLLLQVLRDNKVEARADELALVAAVTAHAKHVPGKEFAHSLGQKKPGGEGSPVMSELRFRQLQTCRDEDSFFRQARRAVNLLGGEVDVGKLAVDLLQWVWEFRAEHPSLPPQKRLKLRWATAYYQRPLQNADQEPA
ncbi:type I-E CRISPR-associated protein Cse2/CasB [Chromobacterium violaceum]|uniref:type I-E CRISPR-associated protein Cse2/CasB n=1 Tax=Chromobacterium violaceum TaxID=536 RepID=UPI003DA7D495